MVKLSIVIPHYNTYELLCKLLNELSIQINEQVEVIVIDDSNELRLDEYCNIATIIHNEERQGLSRARNQGVDLSKGEYIAFIDSDDMITSDYVETLLNAIEKNTDVIRFNWADFNQNTINRNPQNYAVWKAIYKKDILPRFREDMMYNEDVPFQEELSKIQYTELFIDRVLYIYNSNRTGSLMWEKQRR